MARSQSHPVPRPYAGLKETQYKKKKKISEIKGLPRLRPGARVLDATGQSKGVAQRSPGRTVALHVGNAMNMGGETLQLLPRVLLADSPFALGATGSKAPLQRVPGWGWISELMLSTANRSRQLWEAP